MSKEKNKKTSMLFSRITYRRVSICLLFGILVALIGVTYAKYADYKENQNTGANVANIGVKTFELKEHKAVINPNVDSVLESGILYNLDKTISGEVKENSYDVVLPGVDIPKDPFIRLELKSEVNYELYMKVKESGNFTNGAIRTVNYDIITEKNESTSGFWELYDEKQGLYRYVISLDSNGSRNYIFKAGTEYKYDNNNDDGIQSNPLIKILKDDMIYVNQYYVGNGGFSIIFEAYLKQVL